jgi:hypothetical protein
MSKINKRKQFAEELRGKTDTELLALHQSIQKEYEEEQPKGNLPMVAVLYFDIQQIITEMERRKGQG